MLLFYQYVVNPCYKRLLVVPPPEARSMTAFWHVRTSFLLLCLTHICISIIYDFLKLCKRGFKVKETPPRNQRFRSSRKGWTFCAENKKCKELFTSHHSLVPHSKLFFHKIYILYEYSKLPSKFSTIYIKT